MFNSIKKDNLYTAYTAYKTDAVISGSINTDDVIAVDKNGNAIMKDQKREIFIRKGHVLISAMDLGKKHVLKRKSTYKALFGSEILNIGFGEDVIISKTLKPLNILEELNNIDDNSEEFTNLSNYFYKNASSNRVDGKKVKELNYFIR